MSEEDLGTVTIAPEVLAAIARLTALSVPGVARISGGLPAGVARLLGRSRAEEGIQVRIDDGAVSVEVHLVAEQQANMYKLGQKVQAEIGRAIDVMVGLPVKSIDVYIDDVEAPWPAEKGTDSPR